MERRHFGRVEREELGSQIRINTVTVLLGEPMQEIGAGAIVESVLAAISERTDVEVIIGKLEIAVVILGKKMTIQIHGLIETVFEQLFRFGGGRTESENFERTDFRQDTNDEGEDLVAEIWADVVFSPLLSVAGTMDIV